LVLRTPGEPNCLIALFLGKTDIVSQLCKRLVLSNRLAPVWIRSPDFRCWIYSFSTPTQVTVQCRDAESPPKFGSSYQLSLNGTGILPSSSSCYIHSEAFKLLPHCFGRSEVALNRTHIVLPKVVVSSVLLNSVEQDLLQSYSQEAIDLHVVEDGLERAASRIAASGSDVGRITRTLHGEQLRQRSSTQSWIVGVITILISSLTLIFIYFKFCKPSCPYIMGRIHLHRRARPNVTSPTDIPKLKSTAL
jgi:hypothetical protein